MTGQESLPNGPTAVPGALDAEADRGKDPARGLIIRATQLEGRTVDIHVDGKRIAAIEAHRSEMTPPAGRVIDGQGTAALPGLMNGHTHSAMAMLRSYADDMPLMSWLQEKIWPLEARMSQADVYWGARLACLEMIATGTTFFNDMYWHFEGTARAAADSGLRAMVAGVIIDTGDDEASRRQRDEVLAQYELARSLGDRIDFAFGPHAVYTVSPESLSWVAEQSERLGVPVHVHLSETGAEVETCLETHGARPPAWLERHGLLGPRTLAAHCVHLDDQEIARMAERGVTAIHNPISNLKLASGGPMHYASMRRAGLRVIIGTDGCASNNNLDLLEEIKFAALLAKHTSGDPTTLPASEALSLATSEAAAAFGLECGSLAVGRLADIILVDLAHPMMFPGHDLPADLVYSAQGRAVRTTICDGNVLMEAGRIADENEIRREVAQRWSRLAAL